MAKIIVTHNKFADIVIAFLLDKMLHPDDVIPDSELFNEFAEKIKGKGLKSLLMQYYFNMDAIDRVKYKKIKDIFDGTSTDMSVINIIYEKVDKKEKEKEKDGIIKKVIKKLLKREDISSEDITDEELELLVEGLSREVNDNNG